MVIYVAGKYTASTEEGKQLNTDEAMWYGVMLEGLGYHAVVPHLSHYLDSMAQAMEVDIPYKTWIQRGLFLLSNCDAMLVISESPGVKREIAFAKNNHIPIYYSLDELNCRLSRNLPALPGCLQGSHR